MGKKTCSLEDWMTKGCDDAAMDGTIKDKADECCPLGETLANCMDVECAKVELKWDQLKAKDATTEDKEKVEKEMNKYFAIGTACPGTGMPTSKADLDPPPAATASFAWMSLPH